MTEDLRAIIPKVELYTILVSIPLNYKNINELFPLKDIRNVARDFKTIRDLEEDENQKRALDRATALIEYAAWHNAKLDALYMEDGKLKVLLSFYSLNDMIKFKDTMASAILSSTM